MLQNFLHWVAIAAQIANSIATVDGLLPPKVGAIVAGVAAFGQYLLHLLDSNAPSVGAVAIDPKGK